MAAKPSKRSKPAKDAVAKAAGAATETYLREQREAAAGPEAPATIRRRQSDPLANELRRQLLPLLVLHFARTEPTYGNQLIDQIQQITGGVLTVNPNTMYPLLRDFESRGLIEGQWEHPERRSRRFYSLTAAGHEELERLLPEAQEALTSLESTLSRIRTELRS